MPEYVDACGHWDDKLVGDHHFFFFQAEDGIRDYKVTGVQTCALPILRPATKQPALLIVEDLHWSDQTSVDFLHYLARRCPAAPLLVLLTYRSDEVYPGLSHFLAQLDRERLAQECALVPLTRSEVSAMMYAIFALRRSVFTVPPLAQGDLLDSVYTLTEGNPFFIEELLKSLIRSEEHTSELQSPCNLVCRLLLEKKKRV